MNIVVKFAIIKTDLKVKTATGRFKFASGRDLTTFFDDFRDSLSYTELGELVHLPDGFELSNVEAHLLSGRKIIKRKHILNEDTEE